MTTINGNLNTLSPYNPARNPLDKKSALAFEGVLASSLTSVTPALSVVAANATSGANLVSDLNSALQAYGIKVPPSLRITSGTNGLELSGDQRNARFQAMLKDRPEIGQQLASKLGVAIAGRKAALQGALDGFAGTNPSAAISQFIDDFSAAEKPQDFSIQFNGAEASVEERGDTGWGPVKDKRDFAADLLQAYTAYLTKYQVRSTSDDKNSDAGAEMKQKLNEARRAE